MAASIRRYPFVYWAIALLIGAAFVLAVIDRGEAAQGPQGTLNVAETNIDGDGYIRVHEQGLASVDVSPTFAEPFQRELQRSVERVTFFEWDIPEGKVLVVEYVSALVTLPDGQTAYAEVEMRDDFPGEAGHFLALEPQGVLSSSGQLLVGGGDTVKGYASGSAGLRVKVFRDSLSGIASGTVAVSGYLVDDN